MQFDNDLYRRLFSVGKLTPSVTMFLVVWSYRFDHSSVARMASTFVSHELKLRQIRRGARWKCVVGWLFLRGLILLTELGGFHFRCLGVGGIDELLKYCWVKGVYSGVWCRWCRIDGVFRVTELLK